jgi:hypothetical protein
MRALLSIASIAACCFAIAACSGTTTGVGGASTSVSGTVGGKPVATTDSAGLVGTLSGTGSRATYAGVIVVNKAGVCGLLQGNANPPNATSLTLVVATGSVNTPPPVGVGTYTISATPPPPDANGNVTQASASFSAQDQSCNKTTSLTAQSGSISIKSVSGSDISGSFDVMFPSGDHLTGSFSAPVCNVDISTLKTTTACM